MAGQLIDRDELEELAEKQLALLESMAPGVPERELDRCDREYRRNHGGISAMLEADDGAGPCPCEWDTVHPWYYGNFTSELRLAEAHRRFDPFIAVLRGHTASLSRLFETDFYVSDDGAAAYFTFYDELSEPKRVIVDRKIERELTCVKPEALTKNGTIKRTSQGAFEYRIQMKGNEIRNFLAEVRTLPAGYPPEDVVELRVFFDFDDGKVVLLHGFDKGEDASKKRETLEIKKAGGLKDDYYEQKRRNEKAAARAKS